MKEKKVPLFSLTVNVTIYLMHVTYTNGFVGCSAYSFHVVKKPAFFFFVFRFLTRIIVRLIFQHCGINAIVRKHQRATGRKLGTQRSEDVQTVEDTETRAVHAEPASPIVRHAAHHGQRGRVFLASYFVYLHIQVNDFTALRVFSITDRVCRCVALTVFGCFNRAFFTGKQLFFSP